MVNERGVTRCPTVFPLDSRSVAETGPVSRNPWCSTRAAASLAKYFLGRRDSVGVIVYGDEVVSVDRDTGKKQLYVILTKLAGAVAKGNTPLQVVGTASPPTSKGGPFRPQNLRMPRPSSTLRDPSGFDVTVPPPLP
ncbi:MAG: hypothetical protein CM15mP128_3170 [Methanobacteriota archaeon]|nr:MAG: hypothetical protein CM15mP128_3170 [Euryarchaeota archaeon]